MKDAPRDRQAALPPYLLDALQGYAPILQAIDAWESEKEVAIAGLAGSLKGIFPAMAHQRFGRQTIAVAPDGEAAMHAWNDAAALLGEEKVIFLGERHPRKHVNIRTLDSTFAENADVLRSMVVDPLKMVVTDAETLLLTFPSKAEIREQSVTLERRALMKQEELVKRLAYGGFERKEYVESNGDYAVRGGIIDIFPIGFDNPVRIEFFGDEVDSIREFDALNQRSIRALDAVGFVTTLFLDEAERSQGSMFDFFAADAMLFVDEISRIERACEPYGGEKWEEVRPLLSLFPLCRHSVVASPADERRVFQINSSAQPSFNSSIRVLKENLSDLAEMEYRVCLLADSEQQARRLGDLLAEGNGEEDSPLAAAPPIELCNLSQGFLLPELRLAVYTEHEIFNRAPVRRRAKKGFKGISLRELRQLRVGDYVVHVDKGIGKFAGFQTITVQGGRQETAKVIYADNDVLYVNLNYINRLQKYSSQEGHAPSLTKLGSAEWERTKARTKKRLKDIARDLIALYARRKMAQGFPFSADGHWQREMEASFMYEDTPDQAKATEEVKRDMQQPVPMDRLICGDVGYGKTEVAVRAAFKAILDGKQTAVLVPTTILAQQHFNTFRDRLGRYTARIEVLSRFRSTAEQKEVVEKLRNGAVDIVIGTHRLLSADVGFRDLGLLVIDEEHRFGVAAKEKLRALRAHIDTLTLTATPIPRTLNFSLLGARDLSIIETPPRNRLPIITDIVPFHEAIVQEGMQREMARGGQAYFVHDRVSDIELVADRLQRMVPGMRVGVAHGQMKSSELERVMMRFMERKYDLLVCTKIVESGLDIPNANTIFINRTDKFGLAELYQLRGRVGRSNIQAYAYLMIPKESKLSRTALKRLQAIEEFTELGTGFQLAMRDMEIRGAGNLLGAEQSGFIAEIGFELYVKTLEEAVAELKQEEFGELFADEPARKLLRTDVVMELGIDAFFPQSFVADASERFLYYKRMYEMEEETEIAEMERELADRYGPLPPEASCLLYVAKLRLVAARMHLARVTWDRSRLTLVFPPEEDEEFYGAMLDPLVRHVLTDRDRFRLEQEGKQLRLVIDPIERMEEVEEWLEKLAEVAHGNEQRATNNEQ